NPVDEVAEDGHQLIIHPRLEIAPCKLAIRCLRQDGCQHVAQLILLIGTLREVLMKPYRMIARSRQLMTLQVEKFIGRYILGQYIIAMCMQNAWERNAMENDIIFADEMD